jgi:ATP-dependent helicase/nuclease subunit A
VGSAAHAAAVVKVPPAYVRPASEPGLPREQEVDARAAALGRAVHRVLEWAGGTGAGASFAVLAAAAAREFGAKAAAVEGVTRAILESLECAPFFDRALHHWSGNEVPVTEAGQMLRIDRLVRFDAEAESGRGRVWWVLDYKLQHTPESLPAYREQLRRYRDAVRRLQPEDTVRCAFITGEGRVVEVD